MPCGSSFQQIPFVHSRCLPLRATQQIPGRGRRRAKGKERKGEGEVKGREGEEGEGEREEGGGSERERGQGRKRGRGKESRDCQCRKRDRQWRSRDSPRDPQVPQRRERSPYRLAASQRLAHDSNRNGWERFARCAFAKIATDVVVYGCYAKLVGLDSELRCHVGKHRAFENGITGPPVNGPS